jgi:hypothetical protein
MRTKMASVYNSTKFRRLLPDQAQKRPVFFFSAVHLVYQYPGNDITRGVNFRERFT